jgi:hypothetical protein
VAHGVEIAQKRMRFSMEQAGIIRGPWFEGDDHSENEL